MFIPLANATIWNDKNTARLDSQKRKKGVDWRYDYLSSIEIHFT